LERTAYGVKCPGERTGKAVANAQFVGQFLEFRPFGRQYNRMGFLEFPDGLFDYLLQLFAGGKPGLYPILFGTIRDLAGGAAGEDDGNGSVTLAYKGGKPAQDGNLVIGIDLAVRSFFPG
jgi:hypothetical protein